METYVSAFRWAGSAWRRARPFFQSASFSRSLYPGATFAAPAPDFVPRTWLACLLLTGFSLALFAYAASIESGPGPLLMAFSFFAALYTSIPLVATAPVYAPCAARWGARTLHSGAAVLGAVLVSSARIIPVLVGPVRLVLRLLGTIVNWTMAVFSRALAALLARAKAALLFAISLIVSLMGGFTALARPAGRLVRRGSSLFGRTAAVSRAALVRALRSTGSRVAPVAISVSSFFERLLVAAHRLGLLVIAWAGPAWLSVSGTASHLAHSLLDALAGFVRGTGSRLVQLLTRIGEWVYLLVAELSRFLWKLAAGAIRTVASPTTRLAHRIERMLSHSARIFLKSAGRALAWALLTAWHAVIGMGRFMRPPMATGMSMLARLALAAGKVLATGARRAVNFLLPIAQGLVSHFLMPVLKWIGRAASRLLFLLFLSVVRIGSIGARLGEVLTISLGTGAVILIRSASRLVSWAAARILRPLASSCLRLLSGTLAILSFLGSLVAGGLTMVANLILSVLGRLLSLVGNVILIPARPVAALVHRTGHLARVLLDSASHLVRRLGPARLVLVPACGLLLVVTACAVVSRPSLRIVAGSGFKSFEPLLLKFGEDNSAEIKITYLGSLDIAQRLKAGTLDYDAIWDGDSMWTTISDLHHVIKHRESIFLSPIVFGIKRPLAVKLGWIGREVSMEELLDALQSEKLRTMMTSATQSNSGTFAYLGMLYAFAKPTDVLTSEDLGRPEVQSKVKQMLASINRTSESSGFLKDTFKREYDLHDAMFNYESHIIELNQALQAEGKEPLYIVYPNPGLGIADFPFSYVDQRDPKKEELFLRLQKYLMSKDVQDRFAAKGRRTFACGMPVPVETKVFNPDWGVDITHGCAPLRLPKAEVVDEALRLYQTKLRKPSYTAILLDSSGSMGESWLGGTTGMKQVQDAMHTLLDQDLVAQYYLQANPDDIMLIITFNHNILNEWQVEGNSAAVLKELDNKIAAQSPGGNTDFYHPIGRALERMELQGIGDRLPSIILMTDGKPTTGTTIQYVKSAMAETGLNGVPIYPITFGNAEVRDLQPLADLTRGQVYDGKTDLLSAFRKARGNN